MATTAGNVASWAVIGGLGLVLALQPLGCSEETPSEIDPSNAAVLAQVGPAVVLPALERFSDTLGPLQSALEALQTAAQAQDTDLTTTQAAAQAAWVTAMTAWQALEVMQIGPLGSSLTTVGGADGRDEVYAWPLVNTCLIDQETVRENYTSTNYFDNAQVDGTGLGAVEYLLWAEAGNTCSGSGFPNDGSWQALGPDGVAVHRAAFAAALVDQVAVVTEALIADWEPAGGDWSSTLAGAGQSDNPYETQKEGLDAIFQALSYLERVTKDRKLGVPLGIKDCESQTCPSAAEAVHSGASVAFIEANLVGFRALVTGDTGPGLDDLLTEAGRDDLVTELLANLGAADDAVGDLTLAVHTGVDQEYDQVYALYRAIDAVTDLMRGDISAELSLTLPVDISGDND